MPSATRTPDGSKWKSTMSGGPCGGRIRDDGKGIDPTVLNAGGREGHYGLAAMQVGR
jgi:hypothetical protein